MRKSVGTHRRKDAQKSVGTQSTTKHVTTKCVPEPHQKTPAGSTSGKGTPAYHLLLKKDFEASLSRNLLVVIGALDAKETAFVSKKPSNDWYPLEPSGHPTHDMIVGSAVERTMTLNPRRRRPRSQRKRTGYQTENYSTRT
jgi:hypothetical protein